MVLNGASILLGVVVILWLVLINGPLGSGTSLLLVAVSFVLLQLLVHVFFMHLYRVVFTPALAVTLNCYQPQVQILQGSRT